MTVPPRSRYCTRCRFGPIQITMSSKWDWSFPWSSGTTPAELTDRAACGWGDDESQVLGEHRVRVQILHDAQPVEHAVGVRALLDAVADLAELGRLFEHARAHAAARERKRCRDAADAAADDEDFRTSLGAHGPG